MLKTPELAMPRTRKVTTVCNGRREVWNDYEDAKAYFLELMMTRSMNVRSAFIFSSYMDLMNVAMRMNKPKRSVTVVVTLLFTWI